MKLAATADADTDEDAEEEEEVECIVNPLVLTRPGTRVMAALLDDEPVVFDFFN